MLLNVKRSFFRVLKFHRPTKNSFQFHLEELGERRFINSFLHLSCHFLLMLYPLVKLYLVVSSTKSNVHSPSGPSGGYAFRYQISAFLMVRLIALFSLYRLATLRYHSDNVGKYRLGLDSLMAMALTALLSKCLCKR